MLLRSIVVTVISALAGACNTDRIAQLEKQNQELQQQIKKQQQFVDLDTQSKCAAAAKAYFNENWRVSQFEKGTMRLDYQNHYNRSQNHCFILIEYRFRLGAGDTSWANSLTLYDAIEKLDYANFSENHYARPTKYMPAVRMVNCVVGEEKCTSKEQFMSKIAPYMND